MPILNLPTQLDDQPALFLDFLTKLSHETHIVIHLLLQPLAKE